MTILTLLTLFVGAGVETAVGYEYAAALTAGVFAGSLLW